MRIKRILRGQNWSPPLYHSELEGAQLAYADLSGATLRESRLKGAKLVGAVLDNAKPSESDLTNTLFAGANLSLADMSRAKLEHADLTSAKLRRAYFAEADLRFAKLRDAFLWSANFNGSDLRYADLTSASLNYTSFGGTNLDGTIGLDTTLHQGPSFLDIQTIYKSHCCIPEAFLRGVGAPEPFIAYLQSMAGPAIQLYSCFISYSTRDQEFGDRLYADLQANGVRCWFAAHHVKGGRKMHEQIDEAIRVYDRLLVILSEHSMNSEWVKTEISNARQREIREKRQMLFPISLVPFEKIQDWKAFDVDTGKDSAREIREYFIPDFSNWKDTASYAAAFQRLLRDLKAEGGTGGSGR